MNMIKSFIIMFCVQAGFFVANSQPIYFSSLNLSSQTFMFDAPGSYGFANNLVYNYQPTTLTEGSPMIKVVASNINIDFNNNGVYSNPSTPYQGWIGIEVGWTPAELAADSTRVQPSNVMISNLNLYNFDCGLIIHEGVQQVTIQNCNLFGVSYGILVLGTPTMSCNDVTLSAVSIFGHGQNYHDTLVNLKTLINTTYGYGANFFMSLGRDTLDNNNQTVYAYIGIWINYILEGKFENVFVQKIGYNNYATASEGNGNRTAAIGVRLKNSKRILMNTISFSQMNSELNAVGFQLDGVSELTIQNGEFSYNTSLQRAVGIDVTNQSNAAYSIQGMNFSDVSAKGNNSSLLAIGMNLSSVYGFIGDNLQIKFNKGGVQTYGIYADGMNTVNISNSTYSQNMSTSVSNTVTTDQGVTVAAFYGNNIQLMQQTKSHFSSCSALNSAYGLFLKNSSSCQFFDCGFVGNSSQMMRSGEAQAIRSQQDSQEISKHGPMVSATSTGGYGAFLQADKYIRFDACLFNSNMGHRAFGCYLNNCQSVIFNESFASTQFANGLMFDSSLVTDLSSNPASIPVLAVHKSLLFGNNSISHVDGLTTTDIFLSSTAAIRAAQKAGTQPAYTDLVGMCATSMLMQAAIARYRVWGMAAGIFGYNVSGISINNCTISGQASLYDNANGVCIAGRSWGCNISNSQLAFNIASGSSQQVPATSPTANYLYAYNLIGLNPFWTMLASSIQANNPFSIASSIDSVGIYTDYASVFRAQGSPAYGDMNSGNDVHVNLKGAHYPMVSPVGPVSAGLILGDLVMEGVLEGNSFSTNVGNSGHSYGVLLDNAFSVTLEKNIIAGNISNIYGMTAGILDVTANSQNLFMANFLEGNKCSTFNNSNYFVPFNPADPNGLNFPVTRVMNGKFIAPATEMDNIVVDYSLDSSFYSIDSLYNNPMHPDLRSYLTAHGCYA